MIDFSAVENFTEGLRGIGTMVRMEAGQWKQAKEGIQRVGEADYPANSYQAISATQWSHLSPLITPASKNINQDMIHADSQRKVNGTSGSHQVNG